jgi:hypothetical protein
MLLELKSILAEHLSPQAKQYFDEEDAVRFVSTLGERCSNSGLVSDGLMECSHVLDSVGNSGIGRYQKQVAAYQARIRDLEGKL